MDNFLPLHSCSVAFYARVPTSHPAFAKHSQRVPLVYPAATLLHQLHNPPTTLGEDIVRRLNERSAAQALEFHPHRL